MTARPAKAWLNKPFAAGGASTRALWRRRERSGQGARRDARVGRGIGDAVGGPRGVCGRGMRPWGAKCGGFGRGRAHLRPCAVCAWGRSWSEAGAVMRCPTRAAAALRRENRRGIGGSDGLGSPGKTAMTSSLGDLVGCVRSDPRASTRVRRAARTPPRAWSRGAFDAQSIHSGESSRSALVRYRRAARSGEETGPREV